MHTRCPHCKTLYQVTESQLQAASGQVRCCCCDSIFNAKKNLCAPSEINGEFSSPEALGRSPIQNSPEAAPPSKHSRQANCYPENTPRPGSSGATGPQWPSDLPAMAVQGPGTGMDETAPWAAASTPHTARGGYATVAWTVAILMLIAMALAQLAWFSRDRIAQNAQLRPVLEQWCVPLGCSLAPWREPGRFQIHSRSVEPDPDGIGALRVQLVFSNQALFPQPYPNLQLELFDKDEELAARRLFSPEQYAAGRISVHSLLEPGHTTKLDIYLEDPGNDIVGFRFDFL